MTPPTRNPRNAQLADAIFSGGLIRTLDRRRPEVEALAVSNGRVLQIGSLDEVNSLRGSDTRDIPLDGDTLLPGFCDSHAHLWGTGSMLGMASLRGAKSVAEVISRLQAAPPTAFVGDWLLGCKWDQTLFADGQFPTRSELDSAFPDTPVALFRVDGHVLWVNQEALRRAKLDSSISDPDGGRFLRNEDASLSGILIDSAMAAVRSVMPKPDAHFRRNCVSLALQEFHSQGVTSVHDAGSTEPWLQTYRAMAEAGDFQLRLNAMVEVSDEETLAAWMERGPQPNWGRTGFIGVTTLKVYADGALGSHGAALLEPYADANHNGLFLIDAPTLETLATRGAARGFQMATHAIGDAATRLVLDAYKSALGEDFRADHRWRIEHVQVVAQEDIHRFGSLGVTAAIQTQHREADLPWLEKRLGPERAQLAFPWKEMADSGALLIGGSDSPIEPPRPLDTFRYALNGPHALTREQSLAHLTCNPAHAVFQESNLGRLSPGFMADCVRVSGDPLTTPTQELPGLEVRGTWVAGEQVA